MEAISLDAQLKIRSTVSTLAPTDQWDHVRARLGFDRMHHVVEPGLYALGRPTPDSPVFVSANYTLSFDALRSALAGLDGYILVLDTKGVNVWCAAGEGTFGTGELVQRIEAVGLGDIVTHRLLIVPQLGAPGVAAQEVKKRSGFRVEFGPVRAADLPAYLQTHQATAEMRQVRFDLRDRLAVAAVDVVKAIPIALIAAVVAFVLGGALAAAAVLAAAFAAVLLFPALLPWLPTRSFAIKGLILGAVVMLPFALVAFSRDPAAAWWLRAGRALAYLLTLPPLVAFLALMFTGSTTFTSRTGVRREIYRYAPPIAALFVVGLALSVIVGIVGLAGGLQ
jgi:hypothetical protein